MYFVYFYILGYNNKSDHTLFYELSSSLHSSLNLFRGQPVQSFTTISLVSMAKDKHILTSSQIQSPWLPLHPANDIILNFEPCLEDRVATGSVDVCVHVWLRRK